MAAQSFLLTRPAAASARFADALRAAFGADVRIVISSLMAPVFLTPALPPGRFDALILTSETGVAAARRISAEGAELPTRAYCVGDRTARMAAEAGFLPQSAKGDAEALIALICREKAAGRLLHLHGQDSRGNIANRLASSGIETVSAIAYDQRPLPLSSDAVALLAGTDPVILPLFSPRSADLLAARGPVAAPLWVAALSPAVAAQAEALHPDRLAVAETPDAESLLRAVQYLWVAGQQT